MADNRGSEKRETSKFKSFLGKAGKWLGRNAGKALMFAGVAAALGGAGAFLIAVGIPGLMAVLQGAAVMTVLSAMGAAVPYIAAMVGGGAAAALGGMKLAEACGEGFATEQNSMKASRPRAPEADDGGNFGRGAKINASFGTAATRDAAQPGTAPNVALDMLPVVMAMTMPSHH